jgi:hypothetical protein
MHENTLNKTGNDGGGVTDALPSPDVIIIVCGCERLPTSVPTLGPAA